MRLLRHVYIYILPFESMESIVKMAICYCVYLLAEKVNWNLKLGKMKSKTYNTVEPVLETTCIKQTPVLKDHCCDTTPLLKSINRTCI